MPIPNLQLVVDNENKEINVDEEILNIAKKLDYITDILFGMIDSDKIINHLNDMISRDLHLLEDDIKSIKKETLNNERVKYTLHYKLSRESHTISTSSLKLTSKKKKELLERYTREISNSLMSLGFDESDIKFSDKTTMISKRLKQRIEEVLK